jgi:hypothetical protein
MICHFARAMRAMGDRELDKAALTASFVRRRMREEMERGHPHFAPGGVLSHHDCARLANRAWSSGSHDLPDEGELVDGLTRLALEVLHRRADRQEPMLPNAVVREHLRALKAAHIVAAGAALAILDEDLSSGRIGFTSPLLRDYFAGRWLLTLLSRKHDLPSIADSEHAVSTELPSPSSAPLVNARHLTDSAWSGAWQMAALMAPEPRTFLREVARWDRSIAAICAQDPAVRQRLAPNSIDKLPGD